MRAAGLGPLPAQASSFAHRPQEEGDDGSLILAAMNAAPDGILLVDRTGRIVMANAAMETISGYPADELCGNSVSLFLPPALRDAHARHLESYFQAPSRRPMGMGRDLWIMRKDGRSLPVDIALGHTDAHGGTAVAFVRDISEVRRLEARMHFQATHDTLTGLINRWQFGQRLEQTIAESARSGQSFALLLLDLDDFKAVNDGYGHAAGDQVLLEVARRLKSVLRAGDALARLGGDEFTVLLPQITHAQDAEHAAAKLLDVLCQPYQMHGFELDFGASLGIALYPTDAQDAATLLRYADMAMYHAKESGRAHYAFYAPPLGIRMAEKLQLHERLKIALAYGGLALHYQPQVDVVTGRIQGVEALLRWTDPQLGEIPPDRFIPVAEATGLILALGAWVLDTACQQIAAWSGAGLPLRVAVNLSAQQLRQTDLVEQIERSLSLYGARPDLLEIEVTESEAMADPEQARRVLCRLQALGVCIALDDFGTGHSSLAYLKQLPVSRIKIDREFVRPLLHTSADATLVQAIIVLAQTLGLHVVAEGVESSEQLQLLVDFGCNAYQGWLYSRAVPPAHVAQLLQIDVESAPMVAAPV
ncbi:diguanylate cyclase/phosphodiesterase with PAS/PAC sensor(s) [Acidovorax sp. 69]|uniref:putative bifunctional diguanylate cyclase/phosphodiesterase n=1 Tax=Acidovorax sp. 69 TaxID=2035202 RepID=UPI000C23A134|nr:EAL domain-containing protein [Acidovorax sp. 69]PJI96350.1 diguanylate cyclase/phosphodiesterase with PAS/PAC sensor(s) [Acidovorax sp. 69]